VGAESGLKKTDILKSSQRLWVYITTQPPATCYEVQEPKNKFYFKKNMPTLPGTHYCGPFNRMDGDPLNELDEACKEHDIGYEYIGNQAYFYYNESDRKFLEKLKNMRPKDRLQYYNRLAALTYFGAKKMLAPSLPGNKRVRPPAGGYDTESDDGSVHRHRRSILPVNDYDTESDDGSVQRYTGQNNLDGMSTYEDEFMKTGTPDCVGTYAFFDNVGAHVDKPHFIRSISYRQLTSQVDNCTVDLGQYGTMGQLMADYLDQVPEFVATYSAFGAPPSGYTGSNVDYLAGQVQYQSSTRGKLKGALRTQIISKYKNNGTNTAYLQFALYKSTSTVIPGIGFDDCIPSLEHKLAAKNALGTDGTYQYRYSLLFNILNVDSTGQYKKVGKSQRIVLKPGQYCFIKVDTMVKGNPFNPQYYVENVRGRYTKGDYHFLTRIHGDVGSTNDATPKVGTMTAKVDVCDWISRSYSVKVPDDKKVDFLETKGQQARPVGLLNKNVDQPADAV
jgi:hypothetical protein